MGEWSHHIVQDSPLGDLYCTAISVASLCSGLWVTEQSKLITAEGPKC